MSEKFDILDALDAAIIPENTPRDTSAHLSESVQDAAKKQYATTYTAEQKTSLSLGKKTFRSIFFLCKYCLTASCIF